MTGRRAGDAQPSVSRTSDDAQVSVSRTSGLANLDEPWGTPLTFLVKHLAARAWGTGSQPFLTFLVKHLAARAWRTALREVRHLTHLHLARAQLSDSGEISPVDRHQVSRVEQVTGGPRQVMRSNHLPAERVKRS